MVEKASGRTARSVRSASHLRNARPALQHVVDYLLLPIRLLLPDAAVAAVGLTSLEEERFAAAIPYIRGRLLDIGAGRNRLVKAYGQGIGVDVHDWGGGAQVVRNSAQLPFAAESFDTVTFLAVLNHIPYRADVLLEARRVLRDTGRIVVTMINPMTGTLCHALRWFAPDTRRKWEPGERTGLPASEVVQLCTAAGFKFVVRRRFLMGLNNVFVFAVDPRRPGVRRASGEAGATSPS